MSRQYSRCGMTWHVSRRSCRAPGGECAAQRRCASRLPRSDPLAADRKASSRSGRQAAGRRGICLVARAYYTLMAPRLSHLLGTLGALCFIVASGSPVPLHRCPDSAGTEMHAGGRMHADGMMHGGEPTPVAPMSHSGHHAMAIPSGSRRMPSEPEDDNCPCGQCPACCCCAAVFVGLPAPGALVPAPLDVAIRVTGFVAPSTPLHERQPHVLPYGNGPPTA